MYPSMNSETALKRSSRRWVNKDSCDVFLLHTTSPCPPSPCYTYSMNRFLLTIIVFSLCLSACVTGKLIIPDDLSPAELIQRAQEASDRNRYSHALQYYEALHERNPTNIDLICEAEYEIAFIHYKQKKYGQAREELNALLTRYDTPDDKFLPQHFKLLAKKVLERIDEKEQPRKLFSRKKAAE